MKPAPLPLVITCKNCTERIPYNMAEMFADPDVITFRLYCDRCGHGNLFKRPKKATK